MDIYVQVEQATAEILSKIVPQLQKIEKENPGVVMHVEAKIS